MDIKCAKCGGHAVRLLRRLTDGAAEYVCVTCLATAVRSAIDSSHTESSHAEPERERNFAPHQPKNWDAEAAKIARLRTLRLAAVVKDPAPHIAW